ncbi:MAG: ferrous iron transporter B [Lachnospiraceae bacterium]|nr:ferrous iron transporter B [Lachnospiraceae bacterium]
MSMKIALAGNPNSGKTTLFNALTGSNQFVGNWPGVTVEKKEGKLKKYDDVKIIDLPGIYSLSPYTLEEVVARNYLITERPDAILNIIDGTNLERNLYLTTQLVELGIPVVVAVNMMDVVKKNGDRINTEELSRKLGCRVVEISALKGTGTMEAAGAAVKAAAQNKTVPAHSFSGAVEHALAHIEEVAVHSMPEEWQRWYAIKIFERDEKVLENMKLGPAKLSHIEEDIRAAEKELDDDAESIITNERYLYITSIIKGCYTKKNVGGLSVSDKIDKVVTNRFLALPIFALVMFLVYYVSVSTVGTIATDWANDGVFGDGWYLFGMGRAEYEAASEGMEETDPADYGIWVPGIPGLVEKGLDAVGCAEWLHNLIIDGIVAGVGAVLGFVPQMLVLFLFLAFLESCGYMARIAFIMDRIFRKFGLSGKSFIPMLVGVGCGVPGIMASRTIEHDRDRKMTIMTTTFIPCGAKLPVIALIAGAMFGGAWWVPPSAYFIGIAAIILSGVMLKKTRMFAGDPAPFVMELPAYHLPTVGSVLRAMWERGWSFIRKAGTIILLATILIWFTSSYGFGENGFGAVEMEESLLAFVGKGIAWIFAPIGWGHWQGAVASLTGLIAKENVVGTFGVLFGGFDEVAENGWQIWANMRMVFTPLAAYSFLIFNLLCAPCFAAIGAIRREMNSPKWTWFAIGYQCVFAYVTAFIVYQLGLLFTGRVNILGTAAATVLTAGILYMLFRPYSESRTFSMDI